VSLRAIIDATPSGHLTYIVSSYGKPYTAESFGNKFREWCDQAGLKHCSAHGIRKFDATAAAENGATAHQLMAMFGWDSIRQAEHYTRKASQEKLASGAMHLLARGHEKAS
jgi:integrase